MSDTTDTLGVPRDPRGPGPNAEEPWERKAREFSHARLRYYGVRLAASLLFTFLFWYLGWSAGLEGALAVVASRGWPLVALFLLAYQLVSALVFLPFSYYGGFNLQHRFGLSTQDNLGWLSDWVKSTALGVAFFLFGMGAFYLLVPAYPGEWWWMLAAAFSLVTLLLTYLGPVVLLPIFYKSTPVADAELVRRIEGLAERAGTRVSSVRVIDMSRRTVAANAALTGIGGTRRVLLGDTMLREFTPDEVETVVAHELGHHVHNDIWKGLAWEVGAIWAGLFLLQFAVRPLFIGLGIGDVDRLSNLPLLLLLGELGSLAAMPFVNAFSRHWETRADRYAARLSGMPEAYASALYRLGKQNLAELWPPRWVELLLYTHPAVGRRIERVRRTLPTPGTLRIDEITRLR